MTDMWNNRELLKNKCRMELDTIVSAIDYNRVPKDSDPREYVVDQVLKGLMRRGAIYKVRESGTLRETTPYILAQILRSDGVKSWQDFRAEVGRRIPPYAKNPRAVLDICRLPWMLKFSLPDKQPYRTGKPKFVPQKMAPAPELVVQIATDLDGKVNRLGCEVERLMGSLTIETNRVKEMENKIKRLEQILLSHKHIDGGIYEKVETL